MNRKGVVVAGGCVPGDLERIPALVPPTTTARWYGGQAAVLMARSFVEEASESGRVQYGLGLLEQV